MKLKNLLKMAFIVILITASRGLGWGQTNPTPHDLGSSNFAFNGFADGATIVYPLSIQGHKFAIEPNTSNIANDANGDRVLAISTSAIATGSIRNEVASGISLLNSGTTNNIGAILLAINTIGRTNILVTFKAQQLTAGGNGATDRINGLRLQYRIGTTGTFTDLPNTEYLGTNTTALNPEVLYSNIQLPVICENNAVVHLRWIYYISSGSANARDRIRLDDISVVSSASGGGNQNPTITNIVQNPSTLVQYNTPVGVSATITDADGTIAAAELRWGKTALLLDNTLPMSLVQETYTASIPAQANGTTVYYAIYAEDNEGGSTTSTTRNYTVSPVIYSETFDSGLGTCSAFSVSGDTKFWIHSAGVALMNGYNTGEVEEDWLFLPVQNLDAQDLLLSFDTYKRYGITDENNYLKLYYSTNYTGQGNPTQFTWLPLTFTQPEADMVWTPSGTVDLSNISGDAVYIAFKYSYSVGTYVSWSIDNIKLERKTYTVTFNVVDGTTPTGTNPINAATIDFYGKEKMSNNEGQAIYTLVETGDNLPFTVTKTGFHNFNGTLSVADKNAVQQVRILSTKVAVNVVSNPAANTAVITWDGTGAEGYGIHYYVPNTQNESYVSATESGKTILVSPSTTYSVRVRSLVNGVWSGYSPAVSFTTLAGTPVIASNVNITNLTSSEVQVNWTGSGAEAYGIYYYDLNSSASYYITTTASPKNISVMPETTYGIRVRSMVGGVWSPYTQPVEFTTPTGLQTLATNITVDNITSATARVNWIGMGAEAYGVHFYDINSTTAYYITTTESPVAISVLPETTYQVRVRTLVNGFWSSYTQPVQFETPAGGQMLATNIFVNGITSVSATVNWNGSGAQSYAVYYYEVGTSNQFYRATKSSPFMINNLEPDKNYAVRVRTQVNGRWSNYTPPVYFTTESVAKTSTLSSINNEGIGLNLMLYPNPSTDYVNLRFFVKDQNDVIASIYDIRGTLIETRVFKNMLGDVEQSFDLTNLSKGVYVVRISIDGYIESKRLIIQ